MNTPPTRGGHGRGRGRGRGRGNAHFVRTPSQERLREELRGVSRETQSVIPDILVSTNRCPPDGFIYQPPFPPRLNASKCPRITGTKIEIVEEDTFDAAIAIDKSPSQTGDETPVCVLNMASERAPGGGWLSGAQAQEEALCRRSTLSATLKQSFYPTPWEAVIYSPTVMIFRNSLKDGHGLMDFSYPDVLPVVSVITKAGPRRPAVARGGQSGSGSRYANINERNRMKAIMRVVLRMAVWEGHRRLVLGALGCGAFGNPREDVAECWAEVFAEAEFQGGWWEKVVFAVIDGSGQGKEGNDNVGVFFRRLDGMDV
ncbi:hypothetical protein AJ80_06077 [Polytolypa hystricis UAMH7299]|uniref:Microbial-type PARG catalytic domain-containing protein n=1 Tax=Polytolypa hystricis (strain UAMH7299) TaxID=1447883 RepID=A0A2B7XZ66_POLH7|nr:hypothetical protein AJ80_06077 [Polytolypa hystricis UAMH7299]